MTLVMLAGADRHLRRLGIRGLCASSAGVLAKAGVPMLLVIRRRRALIGALLGALNGALVAYLRIPSIVVTLATMVVLRDGLRWTTQGAWVQDLPARLPVARIVAAALSARRGTARRVRSLRRFALGSAIHGRRAGPLYATGSSRDAARLAGVEHLARHAVRVRLARRADRPGRGAERRCASIRFRPTPGSVSR